MLRLRGRGLSESCSGKDWGTRFRVRMMGGIIPFVGSSGPRVSAPGIVGFVASVWIGGSGIVGGAKSARMASRFRVKAVGGFRKRGRGWRGRRGRNRIGKGRIFFWLIISRHPILITRHPPLTITQLGNSAPQARCSIGNHHDIAPHWHPILNLFCMPFTCSIRVPSRSQIT